MPGGSSNFPRTQIDYDRIGRLVSVLSGSTGAEKDQAVLKGMFEAMLLKALPGAMAKLEARGRAKGDEEQRKTYVSDFDDGSKAPGSYWWDENSQRRPINEPGGPALFMERPPDRGLWIAAATGGPLGNNEPSAFIKASSGHPDDFGRWRELFHEGNILGECIITPGGIHRGAQWQLDRSVSDQLLLRSLAGFQIVVARNMVAETTGTSAMQCTWTFAAPFDGDPWIILPSLPTDSVGTWTNVSENDASGVRVNTVTSSACTLEIRRAAGGANFSGASVAGLAGFAFGLWEGAL